MQPLYALVAPTTRHIPPTGRISLSAPSARQTVDARWNFALGPDVADVSTQLDCVVSQALSRIEIDTKAENIATDFPLSLPSL